MSQTAPLPAEPQVNQALAADHGLKPDEYQRILDLLGRTPSYTELGIFSAMWNEHCSYKSSKKWLRTLPTSGPQVIQGPGENAGVVDIGDGQAVVFKMESHNHPSYIEPYQGAATGVGGILRDVFTMGARPIAAMNALSFGDPEHPKTRHLVKGVVHGIGGYGNAFGVPTVAGETRFHAAYNGNCLVNAFAAGLADVDKIFYAKASGVGRPVVYLGAKTGRDGVGGATMASAEFDDSIEEKRPTVQVGDPFTEKKLMEACMELMTTGAVIAIQDMGAAGLTCSAVEMGDKGDLGVRLDLERVPCREENMSAYEMMLSESQERMLMVLDPEREAAARAVFEKWDLDFAIVGETIAEDRFLVQLDGVTKADLPLKALSGTAPEYDRPWEPTAPAAPLELPQALPAPAEMLLTLIGSANGASRAWIWEQYDTMVLADTVQRPGGDAGVVRVHGSRKGLAFTSDVTPRYCKANPHEGGKQAVAETYRNLCAVGATPLAITDNLNFGNPEKPAIMGQFVGCIEGIGEACRALDYPVVSGNVSLYNETDGQAILPTPTIGGVGLLADYTKALSLPFKAAGEAILLIGSGEGHLGQSAALAALGIEAGDAPHVDLEAEKTRGAFIRDLADKGWLTACHDLADGGLAMAAAEMALASGGIGCVLDDAPAGLAPFAWFFGEDQGRYLVTADAAHAAAVLELADAAGVPAQKIGETGGEMVTLGGSGALLTELKAAHEGWFAGWVGQV
ncbi:MAG: phosphoribosylformylglycinamidine synthase subunit PurL [Neomegalonema sp.]|nr:phosphoribosylformylglycinamidine synthase subunit PurL [Neomegalonema sp.]